MTKLENYIENVLKERARVYRAYAQNQEMSAWYGDLADEVDTIITELTPICQEAIQDEAGWPASDSRYIKTSLHTEPE